MSHRPLPVIGAGPAAPPLGPGRWVCFDVGQKRTGVAVSDPLRMIATPLDTIPTYRVPEWLTDYNTREPVAGIIVGMPHDDAGRESANGQRVREVLARLGKLLPGLPVYLEQERYTTRQALSALSEAGQAHRTRTDKGLADKLSATLILQAWMDRFPG